MVLVAAVVTALATFSFAVPLPTSPSSTSVAPNSATCVPTTTTETPIEWKQSRALGRPTRGTLRNGVQLPIQGSTFVTWDPGTKSLLSAGWRRWGTDDLIHNSLCAIEAWRAGREGTRILLGDISLPTGGQFGPEYGGLGHASHQNGLDIDVYYPRQDKTETIVDSVSEIDRAATQALINEFIKVGAAVIYVGRGLGFTDPDGVVTPARKHFDHFHVRFLASPPG